ncbi:Predicted arabinose efflux permease, MFS family [Paramicrobacterium humi]|uniref:Predicted arabinose efflux permease, MFS family n=1 Tax=Paramicrobacterium humi TaxID=640635 RepID=A0A1H4KTQ5_9MICO|nr:MFS transporter [Microbacterium humi]SEB61924.1 Predicted arabinose efflux permease, MFS family [Microbacterium humi]
MFSRIPAWLRVAPALFVMAWGGNHFTPLLHLYEQIGHYTTLDVNLLLGLYVLGLIPGLLLAGPISDHRGRKPVTIAGVLLSIAGNAVIAAGLGNLVVLCAGRLLAGVGVGIAMAVGTSWIKELSSRPFDTRADAAAGARRPSLALTLGFGLGAGVSGVLAQWGPFPALVPYGIHVLVSALALVPLAAAPETLAAPARGSLWRDLRVPLAGHARFVRVVLPAAPWIFGAAGLAYAVMPQLVADKTGSLSLAYATLLTVLTLGTGALVQPLVKRLNELTHGRAMVVGMALMLAGVLLAVINARMLSPVLALVAALTLGAAYGICIVAGLIEVQRIAGPEDLAGITGVYYSLAYAGFLLPTVLAAFAALTTYTVLLAVLAVLCAACLALVSRGLRRAA